jgi:hypothetical protein
MIDWARETWNVGGRLGDWLEYSYEERHLKQKSDDDLSPNEDLVQSRRNLHTYIGYSGPARKNGQTTNDIETDHR